MAAGTARLMLLAVLTLAIGACAGRADAAYEYRGTWFGEPEDALAHIRGEGCRTDRFWAATAYGRWIPWFETDVAAANDLFRETFVPFPPDNVPLNGDILAWCGYVPGNPAPTPTPTPPPRPDPIRTPSHPPPPVTEPRDLWEGYDLSEARVRVAAAPYNDEAYWRAYEFIEAELDGLTYGPLSMPFLPVPFCTIQEGRPFWLSAEEFRGWVRDAARAWDAAAGEDAVEYLGDCRRALNYDSADGTWSDEQVKRRWDLLSLLAGELRHTIRFTFLVNKQGEAILAGNRRSGILKPPATQIYLSDREASTKIRGAILHEMGHALTLRHSGSPGELLWSHTEDPRNRTSDDIENEQARRLSAREGAILRAAIGRARAGYTGSLEEMYTMQYDREIRRIIGASPSTEYDPEFDAGE